jgi:hypothetical protein
VAHHSPYHFHSTEDTMNNDLIESPFAKQSAVAETSGSRQLQQRESAEILAMVAMAHRFPRDVIAATDRILNAFTRTTLAEKAAYQYAKGGTDVSGPSIRAAEAIAQMWGNLRMGFREISRGISPDGVPFSEVEAFCWDMETGNSQPLQFMVPHWRDTKGGGYKIKDERDIYELMANQAQRRKRACILAMIPGDIVEAAMNQADLTLRTKADTSPEAMAKMVEAFATFGVNKEHIEKRIQRRLESIQPAQVVMLKRVYASLRDDMSSPADWFEMEEGDAPVKPAAKPEQTAYPEDQFAKSLPTWLKAIADKKKTAEQVIAMAQSKHTLTPEQIAQINGPKTDTDGVITMTYAQVAEKLNGAHDLDKLAEAASLISAVADEKQRKELEQIYERRGAEINS